MRAIDRPRYIDTVRLMDPEFMTLEPVTERNMLYDYIRKKDFQSIDLKLSSGTFSMLGRVVNHVHWFGYREEAERLYQDNFKKKDWFDELFFGIIFGRECVLDMLYKIKSARRRIDLFISRMPGSKVQLPIERLSSLCNNNEFRQYVKSDPRHKHFLHWESHTPEERYLFS